MSSSDRLLVYDGHCNLCSGWAKFLEQHPATPPFRLIPLQSEDGRALLREHGEDPEDPATFLVLEGGRAFRESEGALRLFTALGGVWRIFSVLRVFPQGLRDALYRGLARNRYRWFGRRAGCHLPERP